MTEQELRKIFTDSMNKTNYAACKKKFDTLSHESSETVHGAYLGLVLASLSIDRQEQILIDQHRVLKSMKTQSDVMTTHSDRMHTLTIVILAAIGLQIILAGIQIAIALKWIGA